MNARRDFLKFLGGSAAGFLFTPVPWKLLDDSSIWTQNWSWIPSPARGESTTKFTTCTLCPASCGVKVRCIGPHPVSLSGVSGHPASRGSLCPYGLSGHHLAYHPGRIASPLMREQRDGRSYNSRVSMDDAIAGIARAAAGAASSECVAFLDERPGRAASLIYRQIAAMLPNGVYLNPPREEGATLAALESLFENSAGPLGIDLENTRTILSFGAPMLDGWGAPGRLMSIRAERQEPLRIIQAETRQSRTASLADVWLPLKPGSEAALALGLAHVLVNEKHYEPSAAARAADFAGGEKSYRALLEKFPPEQAATITGIPAEQIVVTARQLVEQGPSVALGGGDPAAGPLSREEEIAIAGLNLLLGSVGREGGIVPRRHVPVPAALEKARLAPVSSLAGLPDHSVRLLIATSAGSGNAIPWSLIERKLTRGNSLVVSLSSHRDAWSARAGYVIAIPAYLEALDEGPTPFDAAAATFSLAAPLLPPPPDAVDPVDFLSRLAAALPGATPVAETMESALKARAEAIHKSGRGEVFAYAGGESKPLTAFDSPEDLWKTLLEGGCWVDSRTGLDAPSRFSFLGGNFDGVAAAALQRPARYVSASAAPLEGSAPAAAAQAAGETHNPTVAQDPNALALLPFGWKGDSGMGAASPVMSKLYQESNLRGGAGQASMNPETGRARGLSHGKPASIRTDCGSAIVEVRFDPAVMPGVIQVAVGLDSMRLGREDEAQAAAASILDLCGPAEGGTWRIARAEVSKA